MTVPIPPIYGTKSQDTTGLSNGIPEEPSEVRNPHRERTLYSAITSQLTCVRIMIVNGILAIDLRRLVSRAPPRRPFTRLLARYHSRNAN